MKMSFIIILFVLPSLFLGQEYNWQDYYSVKSDSINFELGGNPAVSFENTHKGFIKSINNEPKGFASLMTKIDATEFIGKRIRLNAFLKTQSIQKSYSIWLRINDSTKKILRFGSTQNDGPKGNNDWKIYEIVTDVPTKSNSIHFGFLLEGAGQIEVYNLKLEPVNESIPLTVNYGQNEEAGKYQKVNDIDIYYEVYGEGQPLVILHGNGASIKGAKRHYPYFLKKNYKIIAVDSRAQGNSGDSEKELSYNLMASDIKQLLDHLGLDSVYLWGHSDGAIIGLVMALKYPSKIKKLVAFAPNILADTTGIHPEIYKYIENVVETTKDTIKRKLHRMLINLPNIEFEELSKIQSEVLLISGDRDIIPLEHTIKMFNHLPNSNLCILPGTTHGAAWEKKELFLQIVTDFFESPFIMPNTIDWFN